MTKRFDRAVKLLRFAESELTRQLKTVPRKETQARVAALQREIGMIVETIEESYA
jgi:hypothetical protein